MGEGLCGGGGLEDLLEFCCLGEVLLLVAAVGWLWSRVAGVHGAGLANSCLFSPTTVCLCLTGVGELGRCEEPDEAWVGDMGDDGRGLERLVAC